MNDKAVEAGAIDAAFTKWVSTNDARKSAHEQMRDSIEAYKAALPPPAVDEEVLEVLQDLKMYFLAIDTGDGAQDKRFNQIEKLLTRLRSLTGK